MFKDLGIKINVEGIDDDGTLHYDLAVDREKLKAMLYSENEGCWAVGNYIVAQIIKDRFGEKGGFIDLGGLIVGRMRLDARR